MKKLIICLILAAGIAALTHTYQWEKDARAGWKDYANQVEAEGK